MPKVSSSGWATTASEARRPTGGGQARRHANSSTRAATWSGTSMRREVAAGVEPVHLEPGVGAGEGLLGGEHLVVGRLGVEVQRRARLGQRVERGQRSAVAAKPAAISRPARCQ